MTNNRKKHLKIIGILVIIGLVTGLGIGLYMFFMPHRDVQKSKTDYALDVSQLVNEYLNNKAAADAKYLSEDGNSKILEVTGTVVQVTEDFAGQKVVLLREEGDPAGVNATFMKAANASAFRLRPGQKVTIKGVIRSGVSYDPDLDMYLNAVVEQSDVINTANNQ